MNIFTSIGINELQPTARFCVSGGDEHILILVLLSAAYPADGTRMSNRIYFQLLYLRSASVSGLDVFQMPRRTQSPNVNCKFFFATVHNFNDGFSCGLLLWLYISSLMIFLFQKSKKKPAINKRFW